jgi:LPXTG-site transpeptidase (sortase) family protein
MPESINALWRNASPLKRALLAGIPAVVLAIVAVTAIYAVSTGGGSSSKQVLAATVQATATHAPATPTVAPKPTETPAPPSANDGSGATTSDSGGSTSTSDYTPYEAPAADLSGPGGIEGTSWSLSIPAIGVNASIYSRTVGGNGQMGDPGGPWQVIWYDFGADGWTGLGGTPGTPGANAIFAGHVDYIHVGPAVFWSIGDLQPGDMVTVNTDTGPVNYSIQWSQWAAPDQDFTNFVQQTGQDSITLVTCVGSFSGGHYSNRLIVRGVRV